MCVRGEPKEEMWAWPMGEEQHASWKCGLCLYTTEGELSSPGTSCYMGGCWSAHPHHCLSTTCAAILIPAFVCFPLTMVSPGLQPPALRLLLLLSAFHYQSATKSLSSDHSTELPAVSETSSKYPSPSHTMDLVQLTSSV